MEANPKPPRQIMIAPNAMKHSLPATLAADAIKRGLVKSGIPATFHCYPLADGGNGTLSVLNEHLGGQYKSVSVMDPLGRTITARYGWFAPRKLAIVELAEASGLHLLKPEEYNPLQTNTYGTGMLIKEAIAAGAEEVWIGVGGSATVDGGLGALEALDIVPLNQEGNSVERGGQGAGQVRSFQFPERNDLPQVKLKILCDVACPLLGLQGAARLFGPQKGATPPMVKVLDRGLRCAADVVRRQCNVHIHNLPKGGAAGGFSAFFHGLLGAELVNGADFILDQLGVSDQLERMDIVITAEGSLDAQSLGGKAPAILATQAKKYGVPTVAMVGRVLDREKVSSVFPMIFPINPEWQTSTYALKNAESHMVWAAQQVGNLMQL